MTIQAQVFAPECARDMPRAAQLSLERMLAPDGADISIRSAHA